MATFVILTGSETRMASWRRVQSLLRKQGHQCLVPDWSTLAWQEGVGDALKELSSRLSGVTDCIVVGHSIAGLILPTVADHLNAKAEVYIAAFVPRLASSFLDRIFRGEEIFDKGWLANYEAIRNRRGSHEEHRNLLRHHLFHDSPAESLALWRQSSLPLQDLYDYVCPQISERSRTAVICAGDRTILPEWQRRASREICQSEVTLSSGHCPHLSQPERLVEEMLCMRD